MVMVGFVNGALAAVASSSTDPSSREMSAAFLSQLPQGAVVPAKEGPACPAAIAPVILRGGASCFAEYKRAGNWHIAEGGVEEREGMLVATIAHTSTWRRQSRVCREHGWQLPGTNLFVPGASHDTLVSNNDCGRGAPQSDVYFVQQEMIYGCGRGSLPNQGGLQGWGDSGRVDFHRLGGVQLDRDFPL
jgi:hypothetical protein